MNEKKLNNTGKYTSRNQRGRTKIEKLSLNDFVCKIELQLDAQGRFTFGPECNRLVYE